MTYEPGERDLVMLQHKFVVEWQDGTQVRSQECLEAVLMTRLARQQISTSTLEKYGSPGGHSAMAITVGVPCGIATQLVLDGVIDTPGVLVPYTRKICEPIRAVLESEGLGLVERVL